MGVKRESATDWGPAALSTAIHSGSPGRSEGEEMQFMKDAVPAFPGHKWKGKWGLGTGAGWG